MRLQRLRPTRRGRRLQNKDGLEASPGSSRYTEEAGTHLEVGELSESLFAARMWALVGSVACVDSAMGSPVRWSPWQVPQASSSPQALGWPAPHLWPLSLQAPSSTHFPPTPSEPQTRAGTSKISPVLSSPASHCRSVTRASRLLTGPY